ncbi:MAG: putative peroxiredoxin [Verrucomicrobiota bacterium]
MQKLPLVSLLILPALLGAAVSRAVADDRPGHSALGAAFNEGPRQAATLLEPEEVGRVDFPITTAIPRAQRFFNQGVAQLHGFWFYEAERSFRQALHLDPGCAMAYWGLAMANRVNPKRAREFLEKIEPFRPRLSARELRWIDAFRPFFAKDEKPDAAARKKLLEALEAMAFEDPEDVEVKVWIVLQAWENSYEGLPLGSREGLEALLREVLAKQPWHPGAHHLRIHLWNRHDDRRALRSAAVCGQSGPVVAHLWHMPGHTYSALKRYADAAWQQEAAARADHAWMISQWLMPDQIHNYAHNNDWLVSNLAYLGRVKDAVSLAMNMVSLPQLAPKTEVIGNSRPKEDRSSHLYGSRQLVRVLVEFERWERLLELAQTPYLAESPDLKEEAFRLGGLVAASAALGRLPEAEVLLGKLEALLPRVRQERFEAADRVEQEARKASKPAEAVAKAVQDELKTRWKRVEAVEASLAEGRMTLALAKGEKDEAATQLVAAKELSAVRRSRVQWAVGNKEAAEKTAQKAAEEGKSEVLPQANWVEFLWLAGKQSEALAAFESLRSLAAQADGDLAALERLRPVSAAAGVEGEWRKAVEAAKDTGVRPALEKLGPFRWEPPAAPEWALSSEDGRTKRLADWKGKPVLLMFYLGSGCIHCIEQLNQFAPWTEAYQKAGVELVAVSSDGPKELHKTMEKAKSGGGFPFLVLADPSLKAFRDYRAYDDFEQNPLHGLFLIDGKGRVRWQNISFEPFAQPEWLLKEAVRLLGLPESGTK